MKFPKLFGKKTAAEEDFDEDDGLAEDEPAAVKPEKEPPDAEGEGEGEGDEGDDFLAEETSGGGRKSRKTLVLAAAVLLVAVGAVAGGAWWLLGDDMLPGVGSLTHLDPNRVILDIPPRPGQPREPAGPPKSATDTLNSLAGQAEGPGAGVVAPPVRLATFAELPLPPSSPPLVPAPDAGLVEQSPQGPLPKIGEDGRLAWQVYARPFPAGDRRPRIAVIMTGLGLARDATQGAIQYLPAAVTLAFDPYAPGLQEWVAAARKLGHEVLLTLPMEASEFPVRDAGPRALVTAIGPGDNLKRLNYLLSRMSGYVGVVTAMGSQFTVEDVQMGPMLDAIGRRGLLYVDSGASRKSVGPAIAKQMGMPRALADVQIDQIPSRAAITKRLTEMEDLARKNGAAVALAQPLPVTVERLIAWTASLEGRDVVLAPVSAVTDRQPLP
ncbi:divergent polysaccharide deacetylase family protein [Shumkonia mesophila]|uniref:divergent polysaccharide deacetylase family protein n=1 Tax=Shumkonia mesophila TaxID=2838854 RepID=UPI0029351243|nr:divergent polysaccharide deacetylase family protein [Shumkonia mesophila]